MFLIVFPFLFLWLFLFFFCWRTGNPTCKNAVFSLCTWRVMVDADATLRWGGEVGGLLRSLNSHTWSILRHGWFLLHLHTWSTIRHWMFLELAHMVDADATLCGCFVFKASISPWGGAPCYPKLTQSWRCCIGQSAMQVWKLLRESLHSIWDHCTPWAPEQLFFGKMSSSLWLDL